MNNIDHQCKVLRVIALHGPMREHALGCWFIDGMTTSEIHRAALALRDAGRIDVSTDGLVDIRGVDRSRWPAMTDAEKHARADAIESAVRVALSAAALHRKLQAGNVVGAADAFAQITKAAAEGLIAARRADAAKGHS